jgi:putative oxidoreductase
MTKTTKGPVRRNSVWLPSPRKELPGSGGAIGAPQRLDRVLLQRARSLDQRQTDLLRPLVIPALRILLGAVFIWFGALKVANVSPVGGLVAGTLPWAPPHLIVPLLGCVEVVLGLALVTGVMLRLVLPALAAHLAGTFLTFVMLPQLMFRHDDPLLLTADGEFVMKNLVLISGTLVLIVHARDAWKPPAQQGVVNRPRSTRWRSVGDGLTQFLMFLFGPADIGPLPPPKAASPVQIVPASDAPGNAGLPDIPHEPARPHITVIPVP